MELKEMYQNKTEKILSPHELAQKFEAQIKRTLLEKFSVIPEELSLLAEDKDGVYLSKEEPNTLCCLVIDQKKGYMYLVAAKITENGKSLENFRSDIVS